MHKCDGCGKVVVNEKDYLCPHCGAVSKKHCDHETHLPDDRFNRQNSYNTSSSYANTKPHKSRTYDYKTAPKSREINGLDLSDIINEKNIEVVKNVAKKVFTEEASSGKKKFKPITVFIAVIFALNIFGSLLGVVGEVISDVGDEFSSAISSLGSDDYVIGVDDITHNFFVPIFVNSIEYDYKEDCLSLALREAYFEYYGSSNESYEVVEEDWNSDFTFPSEAFKESSIVAYVSVFSEEEIFDEKLLYDNSREVTLYGYLTESGVIEIYGLSPHIKGFENENIYLMVSTIKLEEAFDATHETIVASLSLPVNFMKLLPDGKAELWDIYLFNEDSEVEAYQYNFSDAYIYDEYIECIEW